MRPDAIGAHRLDAVVLRLALTQTFLAGEHRADRSETLLVRIDDGDGRVGYGECALSPVVPRSARETLRQAIAGGIGLLDLAPGPGWRAAGELSIEQVQARAAVDMAVTDLCAQREGVTYGAVLEAPAMTGPICLSTSAPTTAALAEQARGLIERHPSVTAIKTKLIIDPGRPPAAQADEHLTALRTAVADRDLLVDANAAWGLDVATDVVPVLRDHGVVLLEEPLRLDLDLSAHERLRETPRGTLQLVADERVLLHDLAELVPVFDVVNLKGGHLGGPGPLLAARSAAAALGLGTMAGANGETTLGFTASGSVAALFDHVDIDSPLWLAEDPFAGAVLVDAHVVHGAPVGLGSRPTEDWPLLRHALLTDPDGPLLHRPPR